MTPSTATCWGALTKPMTEGRRRRPRRPRPGSQEASLDNSSSSGEAGGDGDTMGDAHEAVAGECCGRLSPTVPPALTALHPLLEVGAAKKCETAANRGAHVIHLKWHG